MSVDPKTLIDALANGGRDNVDLGEWPSLKTLSDPEAVRVPSYATAQNTARKIICPTYTRELFIPATFRDIVDWCAASIAAYGGPSTPGVPRIGALAGCGHSGVLVAAAVAYRTGLPMIAVRKDEDTGSIHDSYQVNAVLEGTESYAIIDDLVATGHTIQRIVHHVESHFPYTKPALLLLYHESYGNAHMRVQAQQSYEFPIIRKPR